MTGNGAEVKWISRKLRTGRGFSQRSLSQINMHMRANPPGGPVKIPHFPQWAGSSSNIFGKTDPAVRLFASLRSWRLFLGDLRGKNNEARFRKTVYRCSRPKLPL